jgi:hypothetical protein
LNDARRLEELEANARYATDRYRLYQARVMSSKATRPGRLRELRREAELAERTLTRAQEARQTDNQGVRSNDGD